MPLEEVADFTSVNQIMEYRSIRTGEKGDRSPRKTRPRIKERAKEGLVIDEGLMKEVAVSRGLDAKKWHEVDAIPVLVPTDRIKGGIIHLERAFYTGGNNRRCASVAGVETATQFVDVEAYAKSKSVKVLDQPREVQCSKNCPMWAKPGKKSDCKWRAIVSVMLINSPVFPATVPYRTTSKNSIKILHSSLNAIAAVTGGVLMGIPLLLKQYYKETKDGEGKTRRIPVMTFEFDGTTRELRQYAIAEQSHRNKLSAALGGEIVVAEHGYTVENEDVGEPEEVVPDEEPQDHGVQDQIAMLAKKLGYTGAMLRTLEDKHEGSLESVLSELKGLAGEKQPQEEWSSGDVGDDDWDEMEF